jgi:hypothetical protein
MQSPLPKKEAMRVKVIAMFLSLLAFCGIAIAEKGMSPTGATSDGQEIRYVKGTLDWGGSQDGFHLFRECAFAPGGGCLTPLGFVPAPVVGCFTVNNFRNCLDGCGVVFRVRFFPFILIRISVFSWCRS